MFSKLLSTHLTWHLRTFSDSVAAMAGLKRKIGANASTATESSDTNPSANESGI